MKHLLLLCTLPSLLTGCLTLGPINAKICKDDVCIGFTIPGQEFGAGQVRESGKEVQPVQ